MRVNLTLLFIVCLHTMLVNGQQMDREGDEAEDWPEGLEPRAQEEQREQGEQAQQRQEPLEVHRLEVAFYWPPTAIRAEELAQAPARNPALQRSYENYRLYRQPAGDAFLLAGMRAFHLVEGFAVEVSSQTCDCQFNPDWGVFQGQDQERIDNILRLDRGQQYFPNIFDEEPEDLYQWEWVSIGEEPLSRKFLPKEASAQ